MTASQRVLLINPTITSHRHARFPLAVMSLSAALQGKYKSTIIDGNVDRDFVSTALRAVDDKTEVSEYGKFGWVTDPEGNRVELWQPPA